jgi:hypothetical protein
VIVSQGADDLIVGRLWPSSDQVGRGRYPIIYAAETRGLSIAQLIDNVHAGVGADRGEVSQSANAIDPQAELLAAAEKVGRLSSATSANSAMSLLDCDSLGPQRRGLYRILYRIMSEASVYLTEGAADPAMRSRSLVFRRSTCAFPRADRRKAKRWRGGAGS